MAAATWILLRDLLALGIRFPLFRWQEGFGRTSIISVVRELQYIINRNVGNPWWRTAIATYIWLAGVILLFAAAALVISWHYLDNPDHARYIGPLLFITGSLFLVWGLVQYGGVLALLVLAWRPLHPVALGVRWGWVLIGYALAKLCESLDAPIYELTMGVVSGHTLKHLFAAAALGPVLWALHRPRPDQSAATPA